MAPLQDSVPSFRLKPEGPMGLRDRLSRRVRKVVDRFSGEYSEPAPEALTPYERPGTPQDEAEVVMARLNRPTPGRKKQGD